MTIEPAATPAWVVDASVASKWYLNDEELAQQADHLLDQYRAGAVALIMPHFARHELASAIARAARNKRMDQQDARESLLEFIELGIAQSHDSPELLIATLPIVAQHHVSFYDALYLVLAQSLQIGLVTADVQFYRRIADAMPFVSTLDQVGVA